MATISWRDLQDRPAFLLFYPLDHKRCAESHFYIRSPPHCVIVMVDDVSPCLCADPDLCSTTSKTHTTTPTTPKTTIPTTTTKSSRPLSTTPKKHTTTSTPKINTTTTTPREKTSMSKEHTLITTTPTFGGDSTTTSLGEYTSTATSEQHTTTATLEKDTTTTTTGERTTTTSLNEQTFPSTSEEHTTTATLEEDTNTTTIEEPTITATLDELTSAATNNDHTTTTKPGEPKTTITSGGNTTKTSPKELTTPSADKKLSTTTLLEEHTSTATRKEHTTTTTSGKSAAKTTPEEHRNTTTPEVNKTATTPKEPTTSSTGEEHVTTTTPKEHATTTFKEYSTTTTLTVSSDSTAQKTSTTTHTTTYIPANTDDTSSQTPAMGTTTDEGVLPGAVTTNVTVSTQSSHGINNTTSSQKMSSRTEKVTVIAPTPSAMTKFKSTHSKTTSINIAATTAPISVAKATESGNVKSSSVSPTTIPQNTSTSQLGSTDITLPLFPLPVQKVDLTNRTGRTTKNPNTTTPFTNLLNIPWHRQVVGRELFPVEIMLAIVCIVLFVVLTYLQYRIRRVKKKGIYSTTIQPTTFLPLTTNRGTQHSKTGRDLTTSGSHDYTNMQQTTVKSNTDVIHSPYSGDYKKEVGHDDWGYVLGGTEPSMLESVKPVSIMSGRTSRPSKLHHSHVGFADTDDRLVVENQATETDISEYYPYPCMRSLDLIREENTAETREKGDKSATEQDPPTAPQNKIQVSNLEEARKSADDNEKSPKHSSGSSFRTALTCALTTGSTQTSMMSVKSSPKAGIKAKSATSTQIKRNLNSSKTSKPGPKRASKYSAQSKSSLNSESTKVTNSKSIKLPHNSVKKPPTPVESATSSTHTFKPYLSLTELKEDKPTKQLKQSVWRVSTAPSSMRDDVSEKTGFYPLIE